MTEDEIQACKTEHNRVCAPKRVLPKTPPAFSNVKKDGCEEGYYYRQDVGCDKCSPKCDVTTEDEIQACTTKQNRVCAPKRVLPKNPPILSKLIHFHLFRYLETHLLNEGLEMFLLQMTILFLKFVCLVQFFAIFGTN